MATTDPIDYSERSSRFEQKCFYHPDVTTRLRCSRCEKPICPRCMVASPVGYRCPECARGPKPVHYQASASGLATALGVGVAFAVAAGLLWGRFPAWSFYSALLLGFGVAEGMAWAAKYKRGRELQIGAVVCVALGLVVSRLAIAGFDEQLTVDMLLNDAIDPFVASAFQIEFIPDFVSMGLAFLIVWVRFR